MTTNDNSIEAAATAETAVASAPPSNWQLAIANCQLFPPAVLVVGLLLSGCRLLEMKMPGEPLPKRDLALRHQTREFAGEFAATIQHAADDVATQTDDRRVKDDAVRWKISAVRSMRQATLRTSPTLALIDAWALSRQMNAFLESGAGREIFGAGQAIARTNAQALESRIAAVAKEALSGDDFRKAGEFLDSYAVAFPLRNLEFDREPIAGRWETFAGTKSTPAGTSSEALADLSDRLHVVSEQVPAEWRWRLSIETRKWEDALGETRQTLRDIDAAMKSIAATAAATPSTLSNAVLELRALVPAFAGLEKQWSLTLGTVDTQRAALAKDIATERAAILTSLDQQRVAVLQAVDQQRAELVKTVDIQRVALVKAVDEQRAALMVEVQKVAGEVAERSMLHLRGILKDVLFYGILGIAALLGFPFAMGYVVGRVLTRLRLGAAFRQNSAKAPPQHP